MLQVAVNDAGLMDDIDTLGDLNDDFAGLGLAKSVSALAGEVVEEVTTLSELGYDVGFFTDNKLLNEVYDIVAFLADSHGVSFGDLVLVTEALVLASLHDLDGDLHSRNLVEAKVDGVAGALANDLLDFILFKLVLEALRAKDGIKELLAVGSGFRVDGSALVLGKDEFDWVPVLLGLLRLVVADGRVLFGVLVRGAGFSGNLGDLLGMSRGSCQLGFDLALGGTDNLDVFGVDTDKVVAKTARFSREVASELVDGLSRNGKLRCSRLHQRDLDGTLLAAG